MILSIIILHNFVVHFGANFLHFKSSFPEKKSLINKMEKNLIDPTAIIGSKVRIGEGNTIGPYCMITGNVEIGNNNRFLSHVRIGSPPAHRGFPMETGLEEAEGSIIIGSNNTFFEFVSVSQPFNALTTTIGSGGYFMGQSYIAHDCLVGDFVTLANGVSIAGHCTLMEGCNLGFQVAVHQFCTIGSYSMLGMGALILHDVPPFGKYVGAGPKMIGLNEIGLDRADFTKVEKKHAETWLCSGSLSHEMSERVRVHIASFENYSKRPARSSNENRTLQG